MNLKTVLILIIVVLALIIFLQNTQIVSLQLLFWKISMSRIIFMSFLILAGFVLGILVGGLLRKQNIG